LSVGALCLVASVVLQASEAPPAKQIRAVRLQRTSITLDGRLDDPAWAQAAWITDFVQKRPHEGAAPSDSMRIAIFYDDDAIYVGARMFSRDPSKIQAPLSRRDNTFQAERIWVSFDSYHDRRTAYSFGISASGVRADWYHASDNENDANFGFDPVWEAKANIDALGWTAEMRIPFSQLRFTKQTVQVWGFNANRWNPATSEDDYWIPVPTDRTGWSSFMGQLVGLEGIKPTRRLELMPYGAADTRFQGGVAAADPFNGGANLGGRAGADVKMGLGPNITLDGTVNPDFGQVEADPAVVNLSAFEVFFDEKRPFFTEGSQLLRGNGPSYFYSRRIGARPGCNASGDFVDCPQNATILGAAKVTGRLATGMSLGALTAVTGREWARTYDTTTQTFGRTVVASPAGYGVVRLQQEFGASKSVVGVTLTTVQRDLDSILAPNYTRHAYTGGADWVLRWDRGAYELRGYAGFTHLRGDASDLNRVQRSPVHYFQRPDARYLTYDSTRTTFTGSVADIWFRKTKGNLLFDLEYGWESPAYDPNDAGRLGNADGRTGFAGMIYRQTKPRAWFQNYAASLSAFTEYDFGGDRQVLFSELYGEVQLKNFWNLSSYIDYQPGSFDHSATRGGPEMATASSWNWVVRLASKFGAKNSWVGRVYYGEDELGGETYRLSGEVSIRPSTRFQFTATPNYLRAIDPRQYVTTFTGGGPVATYGSRYVFAQIDQSTFLMQLRANYTIGPDLTLELYGEPFAASGRYYGLGELAAPRTFNLRRYGTSGTTIARNGAGDYTITDNGGADTLQIPNPDFNILSFRSNAVLRWEWRKGSTLYLVWAQNRFGYQPTARLVGFGDLADSFGAQGDNFFALKVSYWIPVN
jgi:nuclear transport factor 2 (NTF2) superfamily protein